MLSTHSKEKTVARVLITLADFQRLKRIESAYFQLTDKEPEDQNSSCQNNVNTFTAVLDEGSGAVQGSLDYLNNVGSIKSNRLITQNESLLATPKLIPKSYPLNSESPKTQPSNQTLPKEVFVHLLRQKYRPNALNLLKDLENHPLRFSYDNHGVCTINNHTVTGATLFEFLPPTFYPIKKIPKHFDVWIDLLKSLDLGHYIKNKSAHVREPKPSTSKTDNIKIKRPSFDDNDWYVIP